VFPLVKESGGYRIERRVPGFEFTPGLLGKISTYVVVQPQGPLRVFAFMYSFLVAPESEEDRLAAEALALIEDQISANTATSGQDRTFEYREDGWQEVAFPRWWVSVPGSH
jgi:hypothetical protein